MRIILIAVFAALAATAQTYTDESRSQWSIYYYGGYGCPSSYGYSANYDQHIAAASESLTIGQRTTAYSYNYYCYLETLQPVLRFNTSGLGTVMAATLSIYVNTNSSNQSFSGRTFYLKKKTTTPPVYADLYVTLDFSAGTTLGTADLTSGWSGTGWRTITLTNPDANLNKSGYTYIQLGHNVPAAGAGLANSQIAIDSHTMTNKPYLTITLAGGARLIVVSDSD